MCAGVLAYAGKWSVWTKSTKYLVYGDFAAPLFGATFILGSFWEHRTEIGVPMSRTSFFILMGLAGLGFLSCRASCCRNAFARVVMLNGRLSAMSECA